MPNHTPYSPQFIRQKRPNGTSKTSRDPAKTNNAGEVIMNPQNKWDSNGAALNGLQPPYYKFGNQVNDFALISSK